MAIESDKPVGAVAIIGLTRYDMRTGTVLGQIPVPKPAYIDSNHNGNSGWTPSDPLCLGPEFDRIDLSKYPLDGRLNYGDPRGA